MEDPQQQLDAVAAAWLLAATLFFVATNGFFVAAEFALVKVRASELHERARRGSRRARVAEHVHRHLARYLSACQLGITLSSLILGWLAEPAVAQLLLAGGAALGLGLSPRDPLLHAVALGLALAVITFLHMTLGEQAPKLWAIHRAESTALQAAWPLRLFEQLFRPFIWVINAASNAVLRLGGLSPEQLTETPHSLEELKYILGSAARAGEISPRQLELAENIFGIIGLEVRHILVPRVDVVFLSLQNPPETNLRILRESGHSRFPLCEVGLDTVIGIVHAKDVLRALPAGDPLDLRALARKPLFVPDTQPLSRLIARMQRLHSHCALVLDEHGTCVGLAFLEDAIEEIVGPIGDEFDQAESAVREMGGGVYEVPGDLALPEAEGLLELRGLEEESDTIGGYVVAQLGRLPRQGDQLELGGYRVTVTEVSRRRVVSLRFEPLAREPEGGEPSERDDASAA
jgi:CBS domain containing-hemolysin-like protein